MSEQIPLDREWRFCRDGRDLRERYRGAWGAYTTTKTGKRCDYAFPEFDDSGWETFSLPHDFMVSEPFSKDCLAAAGYKKRGSAWYRKTLTLPESYEGKHLLLLFEGVANSCEVYFNGSLMARNHSAYTEFCVDLTDRFLFGKPNALAVFVDGRDVENWSYEGAGIYRHVTLFVKDPVHIAHNGLYIKPEKLSEERWNVTAEISVQNSGYTEADVTAAFSAISPEGVALAETEGKASVEPDGEGKMRLSLSISSPKLWECGDPQLYSAECRLSCGESLDAERVEFGFRTIAFSANEGFFLNGKPFKIHGACCHQDHAGIGIALPDSIVAYRIKKLKEAGFNAYRSVHHLASRAVLRECDRQGLLVMDEITHFETNREAIEALTLMVTRDRNHPSVVLYSLFNEQPIAAEETGGKIYRRLKSIVRKLDDTRPVTGAMNNRTMFGERGAAAETDVTGFNYNLPDLVEYHKTYPDRPVIGSEAVACYGTRGVSVTDRERRRIAESDSVYEPYFNSVRETASTYRKLSWTCGYFLWAGFDYRGEAMPGHWPAVSSQFGIMDSCGFPKGGYWFFRAAEGVAPVLKLTPHWNHQNGERVQVSAINNCDSVELFLNDRSLGAKDTADLLAEWEVEFAAGTLRAVGYKGGEAVVEDCVKTAGTPAAILLTADREEIAADGADAVAVNVCVTDANGVTVPYFDPLIRFSSDGGAVILGCGNGDPTSHELDCLPQRRLFSGHCQVLVKCEPGGEAPTLLAECDGLLPARMEFHTV